MILRDNLAVDRTVLANERTFLAFIRTSLTLFIAGISLLKFFDFPAFNILGWIFILLSAVVIITGFIKRKQISQRISQEIKC